MEIMGTQGEKIVTVIWKCPKNFHFTLMFVNLLLPEFKVHAYKYLSFIDCTCSKVKKVVNSLEIEFHMKIK